MKIISIFLVLLSWQVLQNEKVRNLVHNGSSVKTTFEVNKRFLGTYKGSKTGFLTLNSDGSGVYKYDFPKLSNACPGENIDINWGFILEDNGDIVRFKRDYGYSYPIIYNCSGENTFRGCTKNSMVDYLLEYKDGTITISSSDDWEKIDQ